MQNTIKTLSLLSTVLMAFTINADVLNINKEQRSSLSLSIYNNELALVNDTRSVNLPSGMMTLNLQAVSPLINHASAVLRDDAGDISVLEQNFRDITTPQDMLTQAVGQTVTLIRTNQMNGEQSSERAKILAINGGLILEINGRYETELAGRRIVYDELPAGVLSPTLSARIQNKQAQDTLLNLSYLSGGLSWRADYIAQLNEKPNEITLRAMATLDNHSGIDFDDAHIELIAGAVNRVQERMIGRMQKSAMAASIAEDAPVHAPLSDFHLYRLPGKYALLDGQSKQVALFETHEIPINRVYRLSGQASFYYSPNMPEQEHKIDSFIEFNNDKAAQLGIPLPAGVVRVYSKRLTVSADTNKVTSLRFVGEDRIDHTPAQAKVRLKTGQVFDLNALRRQTAFRRLPVQQPYRNHNEVEIETVLTNAKDEAVTINVEEQFSGEWSLIDGPKPVKSNARSATWAVDVPAHGKATLRITTRVKS